jgi:AbrB family looped-hinge helix DNA binding protein
MMKMKTFTTKLSSRGQVVIPKDLRTDLKVGTPFVIDRKDETIILKKVNLEKDWEEFEKIMKKVRANAKKAGLKPSDVPKMIKRFREEKNRQEK